MLSEIFVMFKLHRFFEARGSHIDYISIYINYGYYLGICPFRITNKQNSTVNIEPGIKQVQSPQIKNWLPQKVFCLFGHILAFFWLIEKLRQSESSKKRDAAYYIRIGDLILGVLIKVVVLKKMWFNQDYFLQLINYIRNKTYIFKLQETSSTIMVYILCVYNTILSLASICGGVHMWPRGDKNTWNSTLWFDKMMVASKHLFFIENHRNQTNLNFSFIQSWDEYIFFSFATFGFVQRHMLSFYGDIRLVVSVYTLWIATAHFHCQIKESNMQQISNENDKCFVKKLSWKTVDCNFKDLKQLSEILNNLIGTQVTCMLLQFTFHDARTIVGFRKRLDNHDWGGLVRKLTYTGTSFGFLWFAANACHKVNSFKVFIMLYSSKKLNSSWFLQKNIIKRWLAIPENRMEISNEQLQIILDEVNHNEVGIHGSGIFTVTYALVASVSIFI